MMKIQLNGHTLAHIAISMIFKPYSILDPNFGCPQEQKLTKTEKTKLFLKIIPRTFRAFFVLALFKL